MVKSNSLMNTVGEKNHHKSSEMLSAIFNLNPDAIALTRASDGTFIDCNQKFLDQIGYSRDEVIGQTSLGLKLYSPRKRQDYVDQIRIKNRLNNFEVKIRRKDGKFIYNLFSAQFITLNGEKMILNMGKDITKLKRAENQLIQSEGRFQSVLDNSMDVIYRFNLQTGIYEYMSPAIRALNFEPEELMSMSNEEVMSRVHPDDLPGLVKDLKHINNTGEGLSEYRFRGKDGKYRWWSNQMVIINDSEDNPLYRDGFVRDISKRKSDEKKLLQTMAELKRSNKELEQFAYVSSHDLKEPLRMVTLFSQLLQKRYQNRLDDDADEFIEYIVEGAQRMNQLITDLLTYSRVTTHAKKYERVDLEKVLDDVLATLSVSVKESKATITHDPLPTIFSEPSQMGQVFQNLIANAIKFKGPKTPKIHISAIKEDKKWIFKVSDNGIGIDPEHQEQIFDVFRRLHTRKKFPGTGIGLSICQKIIKNHGGKIWVESELGKGSNFYFTIPDK